MEYIFESIPPHERFLIVDGYNRPFIVSRSPKKTDFINNCFARLNYKGSVDPGAKHIFHPETNPGRAQMVCFSNVSEHIRIIRYLERITRVGNILFSFGPTTARRCSINPLHSSSTSDRCTRWIRAQA